MKILLFGSSGQLGQEVIIRAKALHFPVVAPVETELDIGDRDAVQFIANKARADLAVNCAAYTAVDKAEEEEELAYKVNRDGVLHIAQAAKEAGSRMIHISTDYVFDGTSKIPLTEDAHPAPLNIYGASKLAGEHVVRELLGSQALIVRTSSLHGQRGANFVHTMIKLFGERDLVRVVSDQYMCPTWAGWLAEVLMDLGRLSCSGIVHACGAGVVSWYEFAKAIYELTEKKGKWKARLEPCPAADYPVSARRPAYSAMDCSRLAQLLGRPPISWREGLRQHLKELGY